MRSQERMPYLYQFGEHRPGMYTMETSRSGSGVLAALANLKLFGKQGLRAVLGHIVEMAQLLREHLEGHTYTTVLNRDNFASPDVSGGLFNPDGTRRTSPARLTKTVTTSRQIQLGLKFVF